MALSACRPAPPVVLDAVKPPPPPSPSASPSPTSAAPSKRPSRPAIHVGDTWIPVRSQALGLDATTAAARDQSFLAGPPADGLWWDPQLAGEVHGIWTELCSECHDGRRNVETVLKIPPPGRRWIQEEGPLFGGKKTPVAAFKILLDGAKASAGRDMPGFRGKLSNEQLWGLVYFIRAVSARSDADLR